MSERVTDIETLLQTAELRGFGAFVRWLVGPLPRVRRLLRLAYAS
jgi:hypothetical protein